MKRLKLSSAQVIAGGFILMILFGAWLLTLPISSAQGESTDFLSCLFTATSASCVTGLIVFDTGTHWSLFGQIILLILIQIGALGFMTVVAVFLLATKKKLGLRQRFLFVDSINYSEIGGIHHLIRRIIRGTVLCEGIGALILTVRFLFMPEFGLSFAGFCKSLYFGIFHSVTAFCNAGFDLFGSMYEPYCSLTAFYGDPVVSIVIPILILLGGLGFYVWDDIIRSKFRFKHFSLQTKIVLSATFILTVGGTVLFYIFERNDSLTAGDQWLIAFFSAVTPRTAGFNTVDTAALSAPSVILTDILMLIGGGSGSTAGGIKMTTVAVIFAYAWAGMRNKNEAVLFNRSIPIDALKRSVYVTVANLTLMLVGSAIIAACETGLSSSDIIFETISAVSTVGMTVGITRSLGTVSRIVIIFLMYCGRVGSVSFALALMETHAHARTEHPSESVPVG